MSDKISKKQETVVEWDAEAEKIWNEIKDLPIDMYSLPGQVVKQHVQRCRVAANDLYLKTKSSAVLTSLEETLNKDPKTHYKLASPNYSIETVEGYVVVSRVEKPLPKVKPELEPEDK